jgi:hypothetical protein
MTFEELLVRQHEIEANRAKFISALRNNPEGLKQTFTGSLGIVDGSAVCAIGLGCVTFGINWEIEYQHDDDYDPMTDGPYAKFAAKVGLDIADLDTLWQWNDRDMLSFAAIADLCEQWWSEDEH